jgi:NO-binding membrane sensor protein with MHYT domain
MLVVSYNPLLVGAAVLLALMAAFTGLSLTNGLSRLSSRERKPMIVRAAIVLGGGVWSTHFVAMLALDLPVQVFYHPIYTLASALIAILLAGAALLLLHFGERSMRRIVLAGVVMGMGVVLMHYVGMYGMRGCTPVFQTVGYVSSTFFAIGMSIGALKIAYGERSLKGLLQGGIVYGLAILVMHFSAMYSTGFMRLREMQANTQLVSNDVLALLVIFTAFLICGSFLLTTATLGQNAQRAMAPVQNEPGEMRASAGVATTTMPDEQATTPSHTVTRQNRIPYEQDGGTFFTAIDDVVAIQADGHYTRLQRIDDVLFCPIAINKLAEELKGSDFLRTHRSYLVNLNYVRGFERRKDQGACLFDPDMKVPPVPVSRANVPVTMKALGI